MYFSARMLYYSCRICSRSCLSTPLTREISGGSGDLGLSSGETGRQKYGLLAKSTHQNPQRSTVVYPSTSSLSVYLINANDMLSRQLRR